MKIKQLLGKTVLVELLPRKKHKGMIEFPDNLPNTTGIIEAKVLHVGSDIAQLAKQAMTDLAPGDTVLVNGSYGTPLEHDGVPCKLYNIEDMIAKL